MVNSHFNDNFVICQYHSFFSKECQALQLRNWCCTYILRSLVFCMILYQLESKDTVSEVILCSIIHERQPFHESSYINHLSTLLLV